ncbi:origin recognition complex subunit 3 [Macrobrachium rosenbergii]|uniref:origin recognition complex subunit 3 n=1 Tax=Macrobrachium rosenbergii TaxID=79674 RepID=UPI0034D5F327
MTSTVSVSKGVFAFKRKKGGKREANAVNYWPGDTEDERDTTFNNYTKCLKIVTNVTDTLQKKTHAKVFTELVEFIESAHQQKNPASDHENDIPTACLLTGVNMPDHTAIFGSIRDMVLEKVSPHIAHLQSSECSTVRGALFKLISQLMNINYSQELMEEETGPTVKRAQCTMAVLSSWYKEQMTLKKNFSPTKAKASPLKGKKRLSECPVVDNSSPLKKLKLEKGRRKPVVIVFEDVESFPSHVLQDIILICREQVRNIPFVFIFGVATTSAALHRSLSQDASSCLAMETFQAQPSTHYLNEVIDNVLMSPKVPFHLGGRTFKLLLDVFLYHDLSVKNFSRALQVCMLEHFTSSAASILCCPAANRKQVMKAMKPAELDGIRKLPSFRTYVEGCPPKEQAALLLDEKETKGKVLELLKDLESRYARFCTLVKVVNILTNTLPRSPLGRQVREVLATCLSHSLVRTEEYQEVQKMLKQLSREEITPILSEALTLLRDEAGGDEVLEDFHSDLSLILGQLNSLSQLSEQETKTNEASPVAIQAKDRFQLKEKLLEMATKNKKANPYEEVCSQLLQLLDTVFSEHLKPPSKMPLHEVLFFDSSTVIKRQLVGMTRGAVTTALANPHHYLQCECCILDEPSNIVTSLPDVSVAYKLHLECGRLINLYDWLQAFISVIDPEADTSSRKIDKTYQARFVQALLELQFLGFVKQTRRKTDHVARLTWGGC